MSKIRLYGYIQAQEDPLSAKEIQTLRDEFEQFDYYARSAIFAKAAKKHPAVKELNEALKWVIDKWEWYLSDCQDLVDKKHEKRKK